MAILKFDLSKKYGAFKLLNATNGGPWYNRKATDQKRSNFNDYKAARIPYSRNHDSGVNSIYGGPYSHDITNIFPDFDADPEDPASYDFACTDEDILNCKEAGTKTFFRLGQTIEHQVKKHGTIPPKDFKKWAVICEHIIRHYTEGWADGFFLDMPYWEIWNEPNLDRDERKDKRCWGGTSREFFDFYETAAKHLKKCFPHLKIGGPAAAGSESYDWENWLDTFLSEMQKRNVEIDFFSWHQYDTEPEGIIKQGEIVKQLLIKHGYSNAESICNEWNYMKDWKDILYSVESIHGLKDASFIMSLMCLAQKSSIDMLMYYDTRPSVFNGIFDFYTYRKLKGYYSLYWYGKFYDMDAEVRAEIEPENIYSLCGVDKDSKVMCLITHYSDNDDSKEKEITIDFGRKGNFEVYLLDKAHDGELIKTTDELTFVMPVHSCVLIKEI